VGGSLAEGNIASEEAEEEESMAESPSRSGSTVVNCWVRVEIREKFKW